MNVFETVTLIPIASKRMSSKGYQVHRSASSIETLIFGVTLQVDECPAMFTLSLAAFIVGPACSDFSVFVDDGEAVMFVPSTEDCGAGVPSRSLLVESLSDVAGVPFCI